mgnify:CR=1 FL=1
MLVEESIFSAELKDISAQKFKNGQLHDHSDVLIVEAPLEVQLCRDGQRPAQSISVTMRTPGHDKELAIGFLLSEGILKNPKAITHCSYPKENIIRIHYDDVQTVDLSHAHRNFYTTSSCGVCGKSSIESVKVASPFKITKHDFQVHSDVLLNLKSAIDEKENLFAQSGGNHSVALFSKNGTLLQFREDVGRHNAMDKLIGVQMMKGYEPLINSILLLSGRASFELMQKAAMAGISVIASVGAPSSLAYELAESNQQTLIGFLGNNSYNIYTHKERITFA